MTLVEHFERFLGPILHGWKLDETGRALPFQVAQYEGLSPEFWSSFSTIGLSNHRLASRVSSKTICQELLITTRGRKSKWGFAGILQQVGLGLVESGNALLRGDVIGPLDSLVPGSQMEALLICPPVYFPDSFAYFEDGPGLPVVITWLVPVSRSEADFVARHGWREFEDLLIRHNPDVTDIMRAPIIA